MEKEPISAPAGRGLRVGDSAPVFQARSTMGPVRLDQFRGRWLIFFSHPADFTPVCTSEFVALARAAPRFEAIGCALLGLSVDSLYSHLAWVRAIRDSFGVSIPFPILEDPSMTIGRAYGMLDENALDSSAMRATYYIDPEGIVRALTWYPLTVGRSVEEMLRLAAALKKSASGEVMTPEGWTPGADLLLPPTSDLADALAAGPADAWFYRTCKDK
jgi:peroxiredoxin (alkyl hydroperoxide reductase subunit C)